MGDLVLLFFEVILGIALIVSGFLLRKQRLKFLSIEYRGLSELDKAVFERNHDMDKYWHYIGNVTILAGLAALAAGTSIYFNNEMMSTICGIITAALLAYLLYVNAFRNQYEKK